MATVLVKNMLRSSERERKCTCKSWIDHWDLNAGFIYGKADRGNFCPSCKKTVYKDNFVGGHVIIVDPKDSAAIKVGGIYITPICEACNNAANIKEFEVDRDMLVPETGF